MPRRGGFSLVFGGDAWRYSGAPCNACEQEHLNLIQSLPDGKPINEARAIAGSTLTGIMGRESAYSGKTLEWEKVYNSPMKLGPDKYEFGSLPFPEVPIPGKYRFPV